MDSIAPTRYPLDELPAYYGLTRVQLDALLRQLRIAPHGDSLSVAQERKVSTYLYRARRLTGSR